MGAKPDSKLLQDMGLAEAEKKQNTRPSGSDRFSDYDKWVAVGDGGVRPKDDKESKDAEGFPDWQSEAPEVSSDTFQIDPISFGNYFLPFPNHNVGCFSDDQSQSITCTVRSLIDTPLKIPTMERHNAASTYLTPVNALQIGSGSGSSSFATTFINADNPLEGYREHPHMEVGQSVKVGDFVCFNLEDAMGCEAPQSKFYVDSDGHVFVDDSPSSLGRTCGEVNDNRSGQGFDVIVTNGAVDCEDAVSAAEQYANAVPADGSWENTMQHFDE